MIDFSPWPVNLKDANGNLVYFAKQFLAELSKRTGLRFDTHPQTGIQTAEAKFLRGDTKFWIPYPSDVEVAAMGGVSVFSIPVPRTYAHMLGSDGNNDELEMWAARDAPEELVGIIRKAVSGIEPVYMQEMFVNGSWPSYIEQVTSANNSLTAIDRSTTAMMEMMRDGNGALYERVENMSRRLDNFANGIDRIYIN